MSDKYDWRYENSIINGKKIDLDGDYNKWRINNVLANHKDIILYVNEINKYDLTDQMHYDYLFNSVRKCKRWAKPLSKEEKKVKEEELQLISLISEYYKYNTLRAKEALKVLSADDIENIRRKLDKGGVK
jgi:hypothetical protein